MSDEDKKPRDPGTGTISKDGQPTKGAKGARDPGTSSIISEADTGDND